MLPAAWAQADCSRSSRRDKIRDNSLVRLRSIPKIYYIIYPKTRVNLEFGENAFLGGFILIELKMSELAQ